MDRHLKLLTSGSACLYNADTINPGPPPTVSSSARFRFPGSRTSPATKLLRIPSRLVPAFSMMGIGFKALEDVLQEQFKKKGDAVITENMSVARAGYDYAAAHFAAFPNPLPKTENRYAVLSGNIAMAMGGAAAGVKFYCAYPMSPSTGVLHWMAAHARKAGIMVRQVEDEIGVVNMAIGAAHAGVRSMCATSGGGFALMSEGLGMSAMMETPVVVIDCQRAGPSTGVPTKTEQGDLWQMLGAAFRRLPPSHRSPTGHRRLFQAHPRNLQYRRPLSVPWHRPLRSPVVRRPAQRPSERSGFQSAHRSRRTDHPQQWNALPASFKRLVQTLQVHRQWRFPQGSSRRSWPHPHRRDR